MGYPEFMGNISRRVWCYVLEDKIDSEFKGKKGDMFSEMGKLVTQDMPEYSSLVLSGSELSQLEQRVYGRRDSLEHYFLARKRLHVMTSDQQTLDFSKAIEFAVCGSQYKTRPVKKELNRLKKILCVCEKHSASDLIIDPATHSIFETLTYYFTISREQLQSYCLKSIATVSAIVGDFANTKTSLEENIKVLDSADNYLLYFSFLNLFEGNEDKKESIFEKAIDVFFRDNELHCEGLMNLFHEKNFGYVNSLVFERLGNAKNYVLSPARAGISKEYFIFKIESGNTNEKDKIHQDEVTTTQKVRSILSTLEGFDAPLVVYSNRLEEDRFSSIILKSEKGLPLLSISNRVYSFRKVLDPALFDKDNVYWTEIEKDIVDVEQVLVAIAKIHAEYTSEDKLEKIVDMRRKIIWNMYSITGDENCAYAAGTCYDLLQPFYSQLPQVLNTDAHMFKGLRREDGTIILWDWGREEYISPVFDIANFLGVNGKFPFDVQERLAKRYCDFYNSFSTHKLNPDLFYFLYNLTLLPKTVSMIRAWTSEKREDMIQHIPTLCSQLRSLCIYLDEGNDIFPLGFDEGRYIIDSSIALTEKIDFIMFGKENAQNSYFSVQDILQRVYQSKLPVACEDETKETTNEIINLLDSESKLEREKRLRLII